MKITCLGTGSPESYKKRASSGYLVEIGKDKILLDCGGGVVSRLIEAGHLPSDITHLFFTHLHSDHMMDYGRLIHAAWDEGKLSMPVYGPAPIARITNQLFGREGVFSTDLKARCEHPGSKEVWEARGGTLPRPWPTPIIREILPGDRIEGRNWSLSTCEAPHAQPYLDCMAFRLEAGGKIFVYSGDSALCDAVAKLSQDADLLIHWCYRLSHETHYPTITEFSPSAGEIAAMAQNANVKQLLLTHIRKHTDTASHLKDIKREAASRFDGKIDVAEDLMQIDILKT